jgi:hypothetical protein
MLSASCWTEVNASGTTGVLVCVDGGAHAAEDEEVEEVHPPEDEQHKTD